MVKGANFVHNNDDNMIHIDINISVKIIDFGTAQRFKNKDESLIFSRSGYTNTEYDQYKSPQHFFDETYSAMKADIWSLGIIIYVMTLGTEPYHIQNISDPYYNALIAGQIGKCYKNKHCLIPIQAKKLSLLTSMLQIEESDRSNISEIINHDYFKSYYKRYRTRIEDQSKKQQLRNIESCKSFFPYYGIKSF